MQQAMRNSIEYDGLTSVRMGTDFPDDDSESSMIEAASDPTLNSHRNTLEVTIKARQFC